MTHYVNHFDPVLFQCRAPECQGLRRTREPFPTCLGTTQDPHPEARMTQVKDTGQEPTADLRRGGAW